MGVTQVQPEKRDRREVDIQPLVTGRALPQIQTDISVWDAALDRIRWVFEEFDGRVVVSNSGGKDSTVTLELAAIVAKERGELPLNVYWLDQEAEFESTVDYQRHLMYERPDIKFTWYQIPFLLENSTNLEDPWLKVWEEGKPEEWLRPKEENSVHENTYEHDKWHELLDRIAAHDWNGWAILDGIRGEESPARRLASRAKASYKWVTWSVGASPTVRGKWKNPNGYRFHPIHDWRLADVWKAIENNGWRYCKHYDHMFQYGVPRTQMRVSNYHHESALKSLHFLQEIEPATWEAATRRLKGISTYGHLKSDQYPTELPYMFKDWDEYLNYLIDNMVPVEEHRQRFRGFYEQIKRAGQATFISPTELAQTMVRTVIKNDLYGTHIQNYIVSLRAYERQLERTDEGIRRWNELTGDNRPSTAQMWGPKATSTEPAP